METTYKFNTEQQTNDSEGHVTHKTNRWKQIGTVLGKLSSITEGWKTLAADIDESHSLRASVFHACKLAVSHYTTHGQVLHTVYVVKETACLAQDS